MVDVFISYSRRDLDKVALIARKIESEGYAVWWDADLAPHQSYGEVITDRIARAKAALVVWSADAVASEWVRAEADMARNQRKLIQAALDQAMPPLPFNQIQYAPLAGWQGEDDHPGWRKIKLSLADLCGPGSAEPAPASTQPPPWPQATATPDTMVVPSAPLRASSRWPLYAAIGIAAVAVAAVVVMLLGQRGAAPGPVASPAAVAALSVPGSPVASDAQGMAPAAAAPGLDVAEVEPGIATTEPALAIDDDGVPIAPDPADMTIPDSSTRLIAPHEIAGMGPSTLKVARGEILARKGVRFRDPWLQDWFNRYAWYRPRFDRVRLTPIEQRNIVLIRQAEAKYGQ